MLGGVCRFLCTQIQTQNQNQNQKRPTYEEDEEDYNYMPAVLFVMPITSVSANALRTKLFLHPLLDLGGAVRLYSRQYAIYSLATYCGLLSGRCRCRESLPLLAAIGTARGRIVLSSNYAFGDDDDISSNKGARKNRTILDKTEFVIIAQPLYLLLWDAERQCLFDPMLNVDCRGTRFHSLILCHPASF
jgi:hypothetical protein